MNIIAINGSHRGAKGITYAFLKQIEKGIIESNSTIKIINLIDKKINHCIGCEKCHPSEDSDRYLTCIYNDNDDMSSIIKEIKEADAIIFATPVYIFQMSGFMKNFIDRYYGTSDVNHFAVSKDGLFFHHIPDEFKKPFYLLTTYCSLEYLAAKNVVEYFKIYSRFMDAPFYGKILRSECSVIEKTDIKTSKVKQQLYDDLYKAGLEVGKKRKLNSNLEKRITRSIIPFSKVVLLLIKVKFLRSIILDMLLKASKHDATKEENELSS